MRDPDKGEWYVMLAIGCVAALFFALSLAEAVDRWVERQIPKVTEVRK